jgi:hypothetical protein
MSRSKSALHDLSGLMKSASRAPWDEAMDDMLSEHLGPACEATGLDPDTIFDMIGDHWEGPIWGCAFEDLLAQKLEPDGGNIVDDYLKRRGWNEKAPAKAYMRALRDTVMSLYEVSEVVPGQSMTLRDLRHFPGDSAGTRCDPESGQLGQDRRAGVGSERTECYFRGAIAVQRCWCCKGR